MPRRTKTDAVSRKFGAAIRQARGERTLEAVAGETHPHLDAKYLGEIERGWHSPSISTAKRIADALGVPLAELVADLE